jgi:hypothetical protein
MPPAVAALNIGVGPCRRETCGDMLETMARISPSEPNEAMARIAPRRNGTLSLDPSCRVKIPEQVFLDVDSKLFSKVQIDSKGIGLKSDSSRPSRKAVTEVHNFTFRVRAFSAWIPPVV